MAVKTDIEIAREASKRPIQEIGDKLGIPSESLVPYGHDKAKISDEFIKAQQKNKDGKLILVTAINPTPACLLYTSPSPRDATLSRMPSSA